MIDVVCRTTTAVVVLAMLVALLLLGTYIYVDRTHGSYLVYDSGMEVDERTDETDWQAVPAKDKDGNEVHGYACWDEEDRCWRFIWGGHDPLTWDETTEFTRKNVKVFKAFRNQKTGVYIVLLNPSSNRDSILGPTWHTWTPEVWDAVKEAQKL